MMVIMSFVMDLNPYESISVPEFSDEYLVGFDYGGSSKIRSEKSFRSIELTAFGDNYIRITKEFYHKFSELQIFI